MKIITIGETKLKNVLYTLGLLLFAVTILLLSVRGVPGNPTAQELLSPDWTLNGPLELSPERGRFALVYSLLEDSSFSYSVDVARLALPDLGIIDGRYVSLFAPTVSFIVMPGYLVGEILGISQVGTYAVISIFAVLNLLLIRSIAKLLGANKHMATFGALTFTFATPAFAYATTLYQHHISTFVLLLGIYLLIKYNNFWSLFLIWFLCALSISIDNPNLFMMFPIGIVAISRIIKLKVASTNLNIELKPFYILSFLGMILPILFFLWFNKQTYGDPFQLSGTVASVREINDAGLPTAPIDVAPSELQKYEDPTKQDKSALRFFKTRNILNGLYLHILSPDRGIITYTPIMLVPLVGFAYLFSKRQAYLSLFTSIILMNVLLYSMWGDPWGGWAFGSRYLIPSYALLSVLMALFLSRYKSIPVLLLSLALFGHSMNVNAAGALTPIGNPPKVEVLRLEERSGKEQKYTYERNLDVIRDNKLRAYAFNAYFRNNLTASEYFFLIRGLIVTYVILLVSTYIVVETIFKRKV